MIICKYNMVCVGCGLLLLDTMIDSGSETAKLGNKEGWTSQRGGWTCPECSPGPWEFPELKGPPPDYKAPDVRCGECGTITTAARDVCRSCSNQLH